MLHAVYVLPSYNDERLVAMSLTNIDTKVLSHLIFSISASSTAGMVGDGDSVASKLGGDCLSADPLRALQFSEHLRWSRGSRTYEIKRDLHGLKIGNIQK